MPRLLFALYTSCRLYVPAGILGNVNSTQLPVLVAFSVTRAPPLAAASVSVVAVTPLVVRAQRDIAEGRVRVGGGGGVLIDGAADLSAIDLEIEDAAIGVGFVAEVNAIGSGGNVRESEFDPVVHGGGVERDSCASAGCGIR